MEDSEEDGTEEELVGEDQTGSRLILALDDLLNNRAQGIRHGISWRTGIIRGRLARSKAALLDEDDSLEEDDDSAEQSATQLIYSVGFGANGMAILDSIRTSVGEYGVRPMFDGTTQPTARLIHIEEHHIEPLVRCVVECAGDVEVYARAKGKWRRPLTRQVGRGLRNIGRSFDLLVVEANVEVGDLIHTQCSRIEVAVWRTHTTANSNRYLESDTDIPLAGRLRRKTFDALSATNHTFSADFPSSYVPDFPIDIVYTWVDGDDPEWLAQKEQYAVGGGKPANKRVLRQERFRNRNELLYSLRSVELFAPWVNKIHLVTADQVPPWLNLDHPKLNVVSHRDIYTDSANLPTFNSSGIETQLHHISGLSRYFLYFNDDFMLGQLCDPADFFFGNGVLKCFPGRQRAYEGDIDLTSEEYIQADKNAIEMFQGKFPSVGREIMQHIPYPSDTELLREMEELWPDEFAKCAAQRFRSTHDLRPIAFMQYHYGFQVHRAIPASMSHRYLALWKPNIAEQMANVATRRSYKTICINDVGVADENVDEVNATTVEFLEAYFPTPSSFEKSP